MTLKLVAMEIVTKFCGLYDVDVPFLSWVKFHGSTTNINGYIHNTMMVLPTYMKWPGQKAIKATNTLRTDRLITCLWMEKYSRKSIYQIFLETKNIAIIIWSRWPLGWWWSLQLLASILTESGIQPISRFLNLGFSYSGNCVRELSGPSFVLHSHSTQVWMGTQQ